MSVRDESVLVSIVVPVFNGGDYLSQAIDSALGQTWPHTEVIVVDDGSDDDCRTRAIAESYGDRIRLISKPNGGVATALNAGLAAMRGRWFSWLSHDDLYLPAKVETQLRALQEAAADSIAFSDFELMDAETSPISVRQVTEGFDPSQPLWAIFEGRLNGCAMMLPRRILEDAGGFDPALPTTQDYALWFRLLRRYPILPVPGVFVRQRTHVAQGSRNARHLVEAGLLWAEMAGSVTPDEMRRHAPNEIAFLRRVGRGTASSIYPGVAAALHAQVAECLRRVRVGTVWVGNGASASAEGPHRAFAAITSAGLAQASVVVADASPDAKSSLALRAMVGPSVPVFRLWPADVAANLLDLAGSLDAALVAFAEEATPLSPARLREAAAMIEAGEADGVLLAETASDTLLPSALAGAVLSMNAVRAALARSAALPGSDVVAALGLVARLAILPPTALARPVATCQPTPHRPVPDSAAPAASAHVKDGPCAGIGMLVVRFAEHLHASRLPVRRWIGPAVGRILAPGVVDAEGYLAAYPDVRAAGADPYLHYLRYGRREGRLPAPATHIHSRPTPDTPRPQSVTLRPAGGPCRLLVLHALGGGTRRFAELRADQLRREGFVPVLAWGIDGREIVVEGLPGQDGMRNVSLEDGTGAAVALLRGLAVDRTEVLHTLGLDDVIAPLLAELGRPYDVILLDYHLIAKQPHLMDATGHTAAIGGAEDPLRDLLRTAPHPILCRAERVLACSRDLADRVMRLAPGLDVTVMPVLEEPVPERFRVTPPAPFMPGEALRVLFLGDLVPHKGSEILFDAAQEVQRRGLPIEFHQLGRLHAPVPPARQSPGTLRIHGGFDPDGLPALVAAIRPHLAWFPAMAPETHGFALSDAMLLGLPVLARGLGAYPDRLADRAHSWVVAAAADNSAAGWVDRLAALRDSGMVDGFHLR